MATVGQDSTIRFWDIRKDKLSTGECLLEYNPTQYQTNQTLNKQNQKRKLKGQDVSKASSSVISKGSSSIMGGIQASNNIA